MRTLRSIDAVRLAISAALGFSGYSTLGCGGATLLASRDAGPSEDASDSKDAPEASDAGLEGDTAVRPPVADAAHFGCSNPAPVVLGGQDTGYDRCDGGYLRRRAVVDCPNLLPRAAPTCTAPNVPADWDGGGCTSDSDCVETPYGTCSGTFGGVGCWCKSGCLHDSDCQAGSICVCSDPVGYCQQSSCSAGTCPGHADCAQYDTNPGCDYPAFACTKADDGCFADSDCPAGEKCSLDSTSGARACAQAACSIGRPFLVESEARLAPVMARSDWRATPVGLRAVPSGDRARVAAAWLEIARMEHASVGAFARFALQLLALGAPSHLVTGAQQAMADETEHARLAFGLASAYAGQSFGPGPLAIDACLDETSLLAVVACVFDEGCIGETVAAVEAREALERATDPVVRAVLRTIAGDETRHAELAWRTLAWALDVGGDDVRAWLQTRLSRLPEAGAPLVAEGDLLAHGIVDPSLRARLRQVAIAQVVLPCAAAIAG